MVLRFASIMTGSGRLPHANPMTFTSLIDAQDAGGPKRGSDSRGVDALAGWSLSDRLFNCFNTLMIISHCEFLCIVPRGKSFNE